jgi:predicted dehydrogenase
MNRRFFVSGLACIPLAPSWSLAESAKFRVGIIGHTGRGNYGHGLDRVWASLPETEVVAVADADAVGLDAAKQHLQISLGFADYRAMLAETKPEIVAIGPRHVDQHRDMLMACINSGVKGIYIEKPFCRDLVEADEIIAAAQTKGSKIAVAHRNRYHPVMPVIRQLIADGVIGRVLEYRARGKEDARGGSLDLWVLGGHLFNLIHYFAGAPLRCSASVMVGGKAATAADIKPGDEGIGPLAGNEVHARFEMSNGLPAFFDSVQGAGVKAAGFGIQIIGTGGIIDLRTDAEPTAHLLQGSPFNPQLGPRAWVPITSGGIDKPEPLVNIKDVMSHVIPIRDLIAAIKSDSQPLCSAADARITLEMVMGVFESHGQQGQLVALPLKDRTNPLTRW